MQVTRDIHIPDSEIEIQAVRSSGPGGQHVNKVSTAVHLFWDIRSSSLTKELQEKILAFPDRRITRAGVVVIKAGQSRSLDRNRQNALQRLKDLIIQAAARRKKRRATRPTRASIQKRLKQKAALARKKQMRKAVDAEGS